MESELRQLEERSARLLAEHQQLREAHQTLQSRVDRLEADNVRLRDKLTQAISRIEALIARLPDEETEE